MRKLFVIGLFAGLLMITAACTDNGDETPVEAKVTVDNRHNDVEQMNALLKEI